jgi:hypothetical protein
VEGHHDLAGLPLDFDVRQGGMIEPAAEVSADRLILHEEARKIALGVPA